MQTLSRSFISIYYYDYVWFLTVNNGKKKGNILLLYISSQYVYNIFIILAK